MKYFVFADCHGYYSLLQAALKKCGFDENNPEHMLISLGDNFDRGCENYQMFKFLKEMKDKNKIILIKGNHEDLLLGMLYRRKPIYIDLTNGTYQTVNEMIKAYLGNNAEDLFYNDPYTTYLTLVDEGFVDFVYDMVDYYETSNYIFTHGFIPVKYDDEEAKYVYDEAWRKATDKEFASSRWYNGIMMRLKEDIKEKDKTIVVGHFHASYGNVRVKFKDKTAAEYKKLEFSNNDYFYPFVTDGLIALDACTHLTKMVNVLVIEDD